MAEFHRLQYDFAAHLRDPERNAPPAGIEDRRLAVYRELFFNNVHGFLRNAFPVLVRTLGDERFTRLVRDWFSEHRARTPLFPQMPREFVEYLDTGRAARPDDPPWLAELAHYEWVELALDLDEMEVNVPGIDPDGDLLRGIPALSPLAWPLAYHYPVHRIGPGFQPEAPPAEPTLLVVYRNREDRVGFVAVNPVTWRLLELIREGAGLDGRAMLERIAAELQHPDPAALIAHGRELLENLRTREVIAGTINTLKEYDP